MPLVRKAFRLLRGPKSLSGIALLIASLFSLKAARAELSPGDLLLVANGSLAPSVSLADEYRRSRGIPTQQVLNLPLPQGDEISRETYEKDLVGPLRNFLHEKKLANKIKAIVLFYGVPLRVQAPRKETFLEEYLEKLNGAEYSFYPKNPPSLREIQSLERILNRDSSFRSISLLAHLAYYRERARGLREFKEELTKRFSYESAHASVDSELQYLWYDRNQYPLRLRLENPFFHGQGIGRGVFPLLLTGRIDGSTPESARALFLRAKEAEEKGIHGEVFVDARGLSFDSGPLGEFDEELRKFGLLVREFPDVGLRMDDREQRFSQFGEAKNVLFYVGWYSLRRYEDAFQFALGAIGYHIASEECVSLHQKDETGWCKGLLDHGITATLGAVSEPYVDSFPSPLEFFGLMGTGRYSLVEAYALTSKVSSWQMILLGDPLYNPFRHSPIFPPEKLIGFEAWPKDLRPLPVPPGDFIFPDPEMLREEEKEVLRRATEEATAIR